MAEGTQTYDQVVDIIQDYLGPAGKRFLDRQVKFHLDKSPSELSAEDINNLTEWIKVSLALLTDDAKIVDECVERLKEVKE